ncbi:hypothetical protein KW425_06970 [Vibrio fluvialis]|nr:hypothetical protein [Vibrio fluvialis]
MDSVNFSDYVKLRDSFNLAANSFISWASELTSRQWQIEQSIADEEDVIHYNRYVGFTKSANELEQSLTKLLSYTYSDNPLIRIPTIYLIEYIDDLTECKALLDSNFVQRKETFLELWQLSLPLLRVKDQYSAEEANLAASTLNDLQDRAHEIKQKNEAELNKSRHALRSEAHRLTEQLLENSKAELDAMQSRIDEVVLRFSDKQRVIDAYFSELGIAKEGEVYLDRAQKEERYANKLRNTGISLLIASIALLGYLFKDYLGFGHELTDEYVRSLKALGTEIFFLRLFSVLLLTTPAIYLLKESSSHRNKENIYRQRGTQIISLPSYLEGLDDREKAALKHELAKSFFSFHNGKSDTKNVPDFIRDMKDVVAMAKAINGPQGTIKDRLTK